MLENGSLTSARGGTGMTEVAVGMGLAPSGGGRQGQGLVDPAEREPARKRSRIEHGVRLSAMKDNGVKPSKPAKTFVTRQLLPFMKCFKDMCFVFVLSFLAQMCGGDFGEKLGVGGRMWKQAHLENPKKIDSQYRCSAVHSNAV